MQGAGSHYDMGGRKVGIIPAHAGSRNVRAMMISRFKDHPRACREQPRVGELELDPEGSSPRMQGAARRSRIADTSTGIIPAHAGSSRSGSEAPPIPADHPRACREQRDLPGDPPSFGGSSPRMQGAVRGPSAAPRRPRIIPAHAGSSRARRTFAAAVPDHPRACREQWSSNPDPISMTGSSPRMQGADLLDDLPGADVGIIPAHAGSRRGGRRRARSVPDHPRACREQLTIIPSFNSFPGSSPRMQGAGFLLLAE